MKELIPMNWQTSIERLRDNINSAFERYLAKFRRQRSDDLADWSPMAFESFTRGIELDEEDDALIARLALPGFERSDFTVEATGDRLVVRGAKKQTRRKKNRDYASFEARGASFTESIALPCEIDRDRVKARFKNGLLTVTLPKCEAAKKTRLKIPIKG